MRFSNKKSTEQYNPEYSENVIQSLKVDFLVYHLIPIRFKSGNIFFSSNCTRSWYVGYY